MHALSCDDFFLDAQYQCAIWRMQVETDNIAHLLQHFAYISGRLLQMHNTRGDRALGQDSNP